MKSQRGFTLIELLVVAAILVTLFAVVTYSIYQSSERRYFSESERLLAWINLIFEHAKLEGAVYGILQSSEAIDSSLTSLHPALYYRREWLETKVPNTFVINHNGYVRFDQDGESLTKSFVVDDTLADKNQALSISNDEVIEIERSPFVIFFPDGYLEPRDIMSLSFPEVNLSFVFKWNSETSTIEVERFDN